MALNGKTFKEVSEILERVKLVHSLDCDRLENLKEIMTHWLFSTISQDLKSKLSELLDRVDKYQIIRSATEHKIHNVIRNEVEKTHHVDIGSSGGGPLFRLLIAGKMVSVIWLKEALLLGLHPRDFVRKETQKWGEGIMIEASSVGSKIKKLSVFESLYEDVLREVEKDSLYVEERRQRARLIDELEAFLEQIKVFVNLE